MPYSKGIYNKDNNGYFVLANKKSNLITGGVNNMVNNNEVYELNLELNIDNLEDDEKYELRKLAKINGSTISRDVLVPSTISLHKLNYLIQKAFGFSNSHLHMFSLQDDVYNSLMKNNIENYISLVGTYFRIPDEDCESYWDDDYTEGRSFKNWLKSKYQNDKLFLGKYDNFFYQYNLLDEYINQYDEYNDKKYLDSALDEVDDKYLCRFNELMENRYISEILTNNNINCDEIIKLGKRERIKYQKFKNNTLSDSDNKIEAIEPLTNMLVYRYDFGDGWKINITLKNIHTQIINDFGKYYEDFNHDISNYDEEKLDYVLEVGPICVKADGLNVMDDVGGVYGYLDFLNKIYNNDPEKEELLNWSTIWDWKRRVPKPDKLV